jgi:flagellar biosynthesis protein FlhF
MEDWSHLWRLRLDPAMPESEAEARLLTLLIDRDLPLPLAARAARNAGRANAARRGAGPDEVRRLRQELAAFAPCDASLPRIAVLAGPAGAGKTTALVKLAAMLSLDGRRSIQLISADPYRVAAAEQLRAYAGILGAPFASAATPTELHQALRDAQAKDLTLVDLAGFSPAQMELAAPWASYCATTAAPLEVHLVLPATLRSADLEPVWSRFAAFAPAKLLFTRLDEAARAGILLAASCRTELPLSFLSTGPGIPEDFEPASAETVVSRVLGLAPAAEVEATPPEPKPGKPGWRRFDWPEATQTAKPRGAFAHA